MTESYKFNSEQLAIAFCDFVAAKGIKYQREGKWVRFIDGTKGLWNMAAKFVGIK